MPEPTIFKNGLYIPFAGILATILLLLL